MAKKPSRKQKPPPKRPTPKSRVPGVMKRPTLSDHLAIITRAVMQAGLSWAFINARWDNYTREFADFDVEKVAAFSAADVERLMQAEGIIHSRPKIEGTIRNAQALLELKREHGSLRAYHLSFADYDAARKDAKRRFAYLGDLNTYYWRFRTAAPVPDFDEWMKSQKADHPRMREMVLRNGMSSRLIVKPGPPKRSIPN